MKKELAEAGERNGELLMKIEDTNEKIEHLQNTIIKSVPSLMLLVCFYYSTLTHPHIHSFSHKVRIWIWNAVKYFQFSVL